MQPRPRAPWWVFVLVVAAIGSSTAARSTPIHKVIELLTVLRRQLIKDGQEDAARHENYTHWFNRERSAARKILAETNQTIQGLTSDLKGHVALREALNQKFAKVVSELSKNEKELQEATTTRAAERKAFESSESDLMEGIDQLERALVVLSKGKPGAAKRPGGPSLMAVAKQLRRTLESQDFVLSDAERETLHNFFSSAQVSSRRSSADFLQRDSEASDADQQPGEGAASVSSMLQSVLDKTRKELDDERKKEVTAQAQFKAFEAALKREIENKQKTIAETKMSLSQSQEKSGQMQAQLQEATELLKVTSQHLAQLQADFTEKNKYYRERVTKRTDEMLSVQEASQILTGEAMQRLVAPKPAAKPANFLQVELVRRKALHALHAATTPGLALLAINSHLDEVASSDAADPFAKVKRMIQDMLQRLQEEQSKDAQHASWCDSEMTKSTKSLGDKQEDVRKLKDRIDAMGAELNQLVTEITTITHDLAEMRKAVDSASKLRHSESQRAAAALTQYRDAQKLIQLAIAALERFYDKEAQAKSQAPKGEAYKASDMGSGVTGILEVALQDYADLEKEVVASEAAAQKAYKAMMDESEVRTAVFNKDLEYKQRERVRLEGERMRANADLASYNKELGAVSTYLDKLKASCIGKPDSFEERKGRREQELKTLQGALQFLNGDAMP